MKKKILKYYKNKNIQIGDLLVRDIDNNVKSTLTYVSYAIENLLWINGIENLLKRMATFNNTTIDAQRNYHNLKTEFHAFYFIHNVLDLTITKIDDPRAINRLISPNAKSNRYVCDIKVTDSSDIYYFEVKDFSDLFESNENTFPRTCEYGIQVEKWIVGKCQMSFKKGMNYLIARIDLEVDFDHDNNSTDDYFIDEFIYEICNKYFIVKEQVLRNEYNILVNFSVPSFFYGVYIIFGKSFLKLNFLTE